MTPAEFIADLYELKRGLIYPDFERTLQPNVTYSIIETLIATFFDKYQVSYKEVELVLRDRQMKKALAGTKDGRIN